MGYLFVCKIYLLIGQAITTEMQRQKVQCAPSAGSLLSNIPRVSIAEAAPGTNQEPGTLSGSPYECRCPSA